MTETLPGLGLTGEWVPSESGWSDAMNEALRALSVLVQITVIGRVATLPSPSAGDIYIFTGAGVNENAIAAYIAGGWVYFPPQEGWRAYDATDGVYTVFDGTDWVDDIVVSSFISLTDTPSSYTGEAGNLLAVNGTEDGVEFIPVPSGLPDFSGATDGDVLTIDSGVPVWLPPTGAGTNTILYGTAAPTTEGVDGDFYIRTTTNEIFGPKAGGTWPAGTSLIGPTGPTGATGATGPAGANGTNGTNGTSYPAYSTSTKTSSYVAVTADFSGNKAILMNLAGTNTVTINTGLSPVEPVTIVQIGAGQTEIVAGGGVTIRTSIGLKIRARYGAVTLLPIGTDEYLLSGDMSA